MNRPSSEAATVRTAAPPPDALPVTGLGRLYTTRAVSRESRVRGGGAAWTRPAPAGILGGGIEQATGPPTGSGGARPRSTELPDPQATRTTA